MNWEAIGAVGEILGALGVMLTLAFLAYQVIQARTAVRATSYQAYSHDKRELVMFLASDPIRQTIIQGLQNPQSLDDDGRYAFHQTVVSFLFFIQTSHRMWMEKQITDSDWQTDLQLMGEMKGTPGFQIWWPACRDFFDSDFIDTVEAAAPVADMGIERFLAALDEK